MDTDANTHKLCFRTTDLEKLGTDIAEHFNEMVTKLHAIKMDFHNSLQKEEIVLVEALNTLSQSGIKTTTPAEFYDRNYQRVEYGKKSPPENVLLSQKTIRACQEKEYTVPATSLPAVLSIMTSQEKEAYTVAVKKMLSTNWTPPTYFDEIQECLNIASFYYKEIAHHKEYNIVPDIHNTLTMDRRVLSLAEHVTRIVSGKKKRCGEMERLTKSQAKRKPSTIKSRELMDTALKELLVNDKITVRNRTDLAGKIRDRIIRMDNVPEDFIRDKQTIVAHLEKEHKIPRNDFITVWEKLKKQEKKNNKT